jgi:two-component system, LytTR family, sensor kinase
MCQSRTATEASEAYNPRFSLAAVFVAFTAIGVLRFTTFYLDDVTRNVAGTFIMRLVEEATGAYGAMVLFVPVLLFERRYPLTAGRWRRNWPPHLLCWIVYSGLHTTIMWFSRVTILPAVGHGPYDYGQMSTRYFMEAPNDFFAYCAFLGVVSLLRVMHTVRERDLRVAALARTATESRLAALNTRLQPHFLFNSLNTIASSVYDDPAAADAMIGHLGDLLRHALRTSHQPEIPLSDELKVLQSYLAIVDARFGDRVKFDLDVGPGTESLAVPALLLQPLVENAVRHGSGVEYASAVVIRIARAGSELQQLHILIENEIPFGDIVDTVPGTGLSTTRDRLRLLYGDGHTFSARATGHRFEVNMTIPARAAAPLAPEPLSPVHAGADR